MERRADFIIIGGGIAGASAAFELAKNSRVLVLERESQPGYHSTGRSAAVFTEIYGNATIRALTNRSADFFANAPKGFSESPLWSPRPLLMIGREDQQSEIENLYRQAVALVPDLRIMNACETLEKAPMLRKDYVRFGLLDPNSSDLDVHAIHSGFLRGARHHGAEFVANAEVRELTRQGSDWVVGTRAGIFTAATIINAAGAWADEIAELAGVAKIGLVPKRRSAFTFNCDPGQDIEHWPTIIDISEQFYFKPDAGKVLGSPADETPSPPCDAQPEEIDIAIAIDRITTAANLNVRSLVSKWAGLRSFVQDKSPVVGFDDHVDGFFWLAAQGGYGIQTSPAMARLVAALASGKQFPPDLASLGVTEDLLSPRRLRQQMTT